LYGCFGELNAGGVDVLLVHFAKASTQDGGEADEEHAAQLMVVVHQEIQLWEGKTPDDGGLSGGDRGGGRTGIEDGDFAESVAGLQLGQFDFGGLSLAADGKLARGHDVHAGKFLPLIDEVMGWLYGDVLTIGGQSRSRLVGEMGGDTGCG